MATTLNENLARWVFASIAQYFETIAGGLGLPLLVEGVDERISNIVEADHIELRVNGPFVREISHGCWRTQTDINILLTIRMAMSTKEAYEIPRWGGELTKAMTARIPVYKLGPDLIDDDSLIGCLTQRQGGSESVRLVHFGQISREDRIRQSVVDGRYEMYLKT